MAKFWTFNEILTKVELDSDTQDESFMTFDEHVGNFNEAVDEAEADINSTDQEYALQEAYLTVVSGTAEYSLPNDIYAQRIRAVIHDDGQNIYEIKRIPRLRKFLKVHLERQSGNSDNLRYFIKHGSSSDGYKLVLVPTPSFSSSTRIKMWFIRNLNRVPLSTEGSEAASRATVCDIPEFVNFIIAFMKERVYAKEERGSPSHQAAKLEVEAQRKQMVDTLTERFVDDDNEVEQDLSSYMEHS